MMSGTEPIDDLCATISRLADGDRTRTLAVAESLTGGNIAAALSRAKNSGDWFAGGIVAYRPEVKHGLLEVPDGPVVCAEAASAMATSTARLLGADVAVAVTGEGGPQPQEDEPGTVWFGVFSDGHAETQRRRFEGEPAEIVEATTIEALRLFVSSLT
ncbi:CinA family protein [Gordonia polyisoprenivorans]|uniref:CinA family protein n=1 Tax=Gordonia polyisoprenivorans TaxID=84595 RepID=UPI000B99E696|nr:CinA family protein [Gordonia polyisoprenivorans]OZC32620.1 damage-inducible protein CinA [Gordonia polyisoprenivorans]